MRTRNPQSAIHSSTTHSQSWCSTRAHLVAKATVAGCLAASTSAALHLTSCLRAVVLSLLSKSTARVVRKTKKPSKKGEETKMRARLSVRRERSIQRVMPAAVAAIADVLSVRTVNPAVVHANSTVALHRARSAQRHTEAKMQRDLQREKNTRCEASQKHTSTSTGTVITFPLQLVAHGAQSAEGCACTAARTKQPRAKMQRTQHVASSKFFSFSFPLEKSENREQETGFAHSFVSVFNHFSSRSTALCRMKRSRCHHDAPERPQQCQTQDSQTKKQATGSCHFRVHKVK